MLINKQQRDGYKQVLQFIKERDSIPLAEEKQILDCLNLVLDNGWTIDEADMFKVFDLIDLKGRIEVNNENEDFLKFVNLVGQLLNLGERIIDDYFK